MPNWARKWQRTENRICLWKFLLGVLVVLGAAAAFCKALSMESGNKIESEISVIGLEEWTREGQTELDQVFYQEYSYVLEGPEGWVLALENYRSSVHVFLGEEEIYRFEDPWQEKGISVQWIPLEDGAKGSLRILVPEESFAEPNVWLGSQNAVFLHYLRENAYILVLSGSILILGSLFLGAGVTLIRKISRSGGRAAVNLGLFMLAVGGWLLSDSSLAQFLTGNTGLIMVITFTLFMILPYFFLQFVCEILTYEDRLLRMLSVLVLGVAGLGLLFYLLRIASFYYFLPAVHLLIIISIAACCRAALKDMRRYGSRESRYILTGIVLLCVFGSGALALFYGSLESGYAVCFSLGIFLFLMSLAYAMGVRTQEYLRNRISAEFYKKMAYMDIMTYMGNRRAFMEQQIERIWTKKRSCIVMDINNLKDVNDSQGHQAGDQLICTAAACIRQAFQHSGSCYRFGGDEFVVILETDREEEVLASLEAMKELLKKEKRHHGIDVEIAWGYAIQKHAEESIKRLLEEADGKMYRRKQEMKKG